MCKETEHRTAVDDVEDLLSDKRSACIVPSGLNARGRRWYPYAICCCLNTQVLKTPAPSPNTHTHRLSFSSSFARRIITRAITGDAGLKIKLPSKLTIIANQFNRKKNRCARRRIYRQSLTVLKIFHAITVEVLNKI